jgi:hypothetical protein
VNHWSDWLFLGIGGFLVGSFLKLAQLTLQTQPWAKAGFIIVGVGLLITNITQLWLQFHVDASHWFLTTTAIGYVVVTIGLIVLGRTRKEHLEKEEK